MFAPTSVLLARMEEKDAPRWWRVLEKRRQAAKRVTVLFMARWDAQ